MIGDGGRDGAFFAEYGFHFAGRLANFGAEEDRGR